MKTMKGKRTVHSMTFVGLSVFLSALLHVVALVWLSHVGFELIRHVEGLPPEQRRSFSLRDIRKIIIDPVRRTTGAGVGKGGVRGDGAKGYARKVDPSLTKPSDKVDGSVVGSDSAVIKHLQAGDDKSWQQRQAILAISGKLLGKDIAKGNRRLIPDIARVAGAPDIVFPVKYDKLKRDPVSENVGGATPDNSKVDVPMPVLPLQTGSNRVDMPVDDLKDATGVIDGGEKSDRKVEALDDVLEARLTVYSPFLDSKNNYFKLEIKRISDEVLPELPKDIVFIQDSSASMAEQRLHFCREGLTAALGMLNKNDRFNVVSFTDAPVTCFDDWVAPGRSSMEKGTRFIANMRSAGSTDILASLGALKDLKVEKGRPCIAFVITDGLATTGVVESAGIIREFTKSNSEGVSVFTMGTMSDANMYLLDMLSYCNGGSTHVVKGGRWSIAEDLTNRVHSVSRPVLSSLQLAFAGRDVEVFPGKVRHLYMDDPLVLYGKSPRNMRRVTFQAIGNAAGKRCDMIFDLDLDKDADKGSKAIKHDWALQKAYHLMGKMAREGKDEHGDNLRKLAKDYDLKLPYADQL